MRRAVRSLPLFLTAWLTAASPLAAQEATPEPAGIVCDVAPRSDEGIAALAATPAGMGSPAAGSTAPLPEGAPVDAATVAALAATVAQVTACAEAGDLARLLALYSDAYVVRVALAPEPVPIVPGGPPEGFAPPSGTPPAVGEEPRLEQARRLPDGRVTALVGAGGPADTEEIVVFVEQEGRWVIDDIQPVKAPVDAGSPVAQPPAVSAAVGAAAQEAGADPATIAVVRVEATEWPDSSLGCPKPGEFYAQVITPGYLVVLAVDGEEIAYHTDEAGNAVRCDAPSS